MKGIRRTNNDMKMKIGKVNNTNKTERQQKRKENKKKLLINK